MKTKVKLLEELEDLTREMDVPIYRRTSVEWLSRNLAVRNSEHENFKEAVSLIKKLKRIG